jgi:RES domain-containing protein
MNRRVFRLCKSKHAHHQELIGHAFGAARSGGRWHSSDPNSQQNRPMIYTSATLSLAMLEIMTHIDSHALHSMSHAHVIFEINDQYVVDLDVKQLPNSWNQHPVSSVTQQIGNDWFDQQVSPILQVPSVILPLSVFGLHHSNYLLNATHPDIDKAVQLIGYEPLVFDIRL